MTNPSISNLELSTPDITRENVERLAELFPSVATEVADAEGNPQKAIDFDALRDLLGDVAEGQRERYQFTWPGKTEAKLEARKPCDKTLRPRPEKSVDWDTTQNVYIEGDNLDALKVMRETYAGKVKLIYIDPPYNTGHDFIYDDDFAQTREEYGAQSGDFDEEGGRLVANTEGNGRFHSDWCSMMYPRLLLARDLLSDDGAIFISIDSNEIKNLRAICDEVFGAQNFKNCIAVRRGVKNVQAQFADVAALAQGHEYILVYSKNSDTRFSKLQLSHAGKPGKWDTFWRGTDRPTMRYELLGANPTSGQWRWEKGRAATAVMNYEKYLSEYAEGMSLDEYYLDHLTATNEKLNFVRKNEEGTIQYYVPPSTGKLLSDNWMDLTLSGSETGIFDYEKSVGLIERIVVWATAANSIVFDFFSGSATTAHAVMKCNAVDGGKRQYVLVQLPEIRDENTKSIDGNLKTICDIGEERIRRAGKKVAKEIGESNRQLKLGESPKPVPDIGFRVFSIDSSNFLDTYSEPGEQAQASLLSLVDNLKEGRTPEDLLFQVLPAFRIPYSAHVEKMDIASAACFNVNDGQLIACFDTEVSTAVIEKIAQLKPIYAVFRDASFAGDSDAANFEELFKTYSPDTVRRVI